MVKRLSLFVVLSFLVSCAELYQASVILTIEPSEDGPLTQGGYHVQFFETDGTLVGDIASTFVPFAEGAQEVVLVLREASHFAKSDTVTYTVVVEAVPTEDAKPTARGTVQVTFTKGVDGEQMVRLVDDPRANLDADLFVYNTIGNEGEPSTVRLTWLASPPSGFTYHLWSVREGVATWEKVLDTGLANDVEFEFDGATLLVTAEVVAEQISRPSGWQMYSSDGPGHSEDDIEIIAEANSIFEDLSKVLKMADSHGGFCLDAAVGDDGAGVVNHAEHFWNLLVGDSHPFHEQKDQDQSGVIETPGGDETGVRPYLMQLREHFDENYELLPAATVAMSSVGRLRQCAKNLEAIDVLNGTNDEDVEADHETSAVGRALDAAQGIIDDYEGTDAQAALQAAVDGVWGDEFDPVRDATIAAGHTGNCLRDRVAAIGGFTFERLDLGEAVLPQGL